MFCIALQMLAGGRWDWLLWTCGQRGDLKEHFAPTGLYVDCACSFVSRAYAREGLRRDTLCLQVSDLC